MILIAHRGNLNGRIPERENTQLYIDEAINNGFHVEIDVRTKNNKLYLGHDEPQYPVSIDWLLGRSKFLYIHTKDFESLNTLVSYKELKIFFHTCEEHMVISNTNVIWSHNIKDASDKSIIPLLSFEDLKNNFPTKPVYGICTDYVLNVNVVQKQVIKEENGILEYFIWRNYLNVEALPSTINGLSRIPQLINYDNNSEWPIPISCSTEVSDCNFYNIIDIVKNHMTDGILELGVYNGWKMAEKVAKTTTDALLSNKPDNIPYLGVDIEDKSFLNDENKKIHTLISDTRDFDKVKSYLKQIGMEKVSVLLIDGDHSLNMVINDWKYTELLSDNGVVIFRDVNNHPPAIFIDFIDRNMYDVVEPCKILDDYGLGVAYKKPIPKIDYSQFAEDSYIKSFFTENKKYYGIEIGASNGIIHSTTKSLEESGWDVLCIEPNKKSFDLCAENRKFVFNYAVGKENNDSAIFTVFSLTDGNQTAISSLMPDLRLLKQHIDMGVLDHVHTENVKLRTLDSCIEEWITLLSEPINKIDFVSIDVEGTEIDVLNGFDLNKWSPTLIEIENNFEDEVCRDKMKENGYILINRIGVNDYFIKK